jgi:hypothetical protein
MKLEAPVAPGAPARIAITDRPNGTEPIIAVSSEEIPFLENTAWGPRMGTGIRWALVESDIRRLDQGLGCPQCLTVFPFPALAENIGAWRALGAPAWNWGDVTMRDRGLSLVMVNCCPICGVEQSPEMYALQDEGAISRHTDQEWKDTVDGFEERAEAYFEKVEREKRSTGFKPRGGFLTQGRPVKGD